MALENVLFPQDSFYYGGREFWGCESYMLQQHEEHKDFSQISNKNVTTNLQYETSLHQSCSSSAVMIQDMNNKLWGHNNCSPDGANTSCAANGQIGSGEVSPAEAPVPTPDRKRRRRTRTCKNKEDMESQRMTHIAVERNRRKQMNEYLAVIRSLMPTSYVQRVRTYIHI